MFTSAKIHSFKHGPFFFGGGRRGGGGGGGGGGISRYSTVITYVIAGILPQGIPVLIAGWYDELEISVTVHLHMGRDSCSMRGPVTAVQSGDGPSRRLQRAGVRERHRQRKECSVQIKQQTSRTGIGDAAKRSIRCKDSPEPGREQSGRVCKQQELYLL